MKQLKDFVDTRQKAWCIHCGASLGSVQTSRDHVPSKVLLNRPLPENVPVVTICAPCNASFAHDEEYHRRPSPDGIRPRPPRTLHNVPAVDFVVERVKTSLGSALAAR